MDREEIRNWIASGLFGGYKAEQARDALAKAGFRPEEVEQELLAAAPYIEAARKMSKKLYRREALLKTLDLHMRGTSHYLRAEKIMLPPFPRFLEEYYYPNRLGVFSNALEHCEARNWTPSSLAGKVGTDTIIEAQHMRENDTAYEQDAKKHPKQMKFGEYVAMMENTAAQNDFYITADNYFFNHNAFAVLRKEIRDIGDGYLVPEDTDRNKQFFFIGPKDTLTPAHYDNVDNLLIQIYGRKRIRLIPAMQVPYLYNNRHARSSDCDLFDVKPELYPDLSNMTVMDIEIGPGDCVFIPVGWWHHITSLTPSITVGCANINADNDFKVLIP